MINLFILGAILSIIALLAGLLGLIRFPASIGHWLIPSAVAFALFVVIVFSIGGISLRRFVNPLEELLKAADRVGQGDYSTRVAERGPREVRSLVRAFNDMGSRLYQLDEQRRNLMADVTHELRTPLTVVQGNLEGMLDGVYPADEATLRLLIDETKVISRLVEDLRTLALAESGALQLKKEPTDLAMLIRDVLTSLQTQVEAANIVMTTDIAPDLPWLEIDPERIHQVLTNLLVNALRYTRVGGTVSVHYHQADAHALIVVQDSGAGIPAEELPYVFERFYKSSDSGGMGLGLAIAKHLVEAHGGTIIAESSPGKGTLMRVTLPMEN
jgi:signal transduction histidine kinase